MKKNILLSFLVLIAGSSFSQYKKASFLSKEGRTHELGTNVSFISNGGGTPVLSVVYTGSLETEKKVSLYSDIEVMLKGKFSYTADYYSSTSGNTSGKLTGETPLYLMIKYGAQYRFIQADNTDETGLVPYVKFALLYGVAFKSEYNLKDKDGNSISGGNATPPMPDQETPFGFEAGAGATYYFTRNLGIKFGVGYRQLLHINGINDGGNAADTYFPLKSHPAICISFKYRIFRDAD